jgi:gluconate 2-dehydrogenase alpha chain
VALERGPMRSTKDFASPRAHDELRYASRHELMQDPAQDTVTVRNRSSQEALPMRQLGAFLPGSGVGGSGVHWAGMTWRWPDMEFRARSLYEERYGKSFIPAEMPLADWGIRYQELEPHYDRFEYMAAVSGKAGNLAGMIQPGGNPFEAPRAREYPLPPLERDLASELFSNAARTLGYAPFPTPAASASRPYVNPDGVRFGACEYCGFCDRCGCAYDAKGSPLHTVIPLAQARPNFELRTGAWVTRVLYDKAAKRATGVLYTDVKTGEEFEQPAGIVALCAYALNNVHLMLLSQIGAPYDPAAQTGVIGRNTTYQWLTSAQLFFERRHFNPFMQTGAQGAMIDDLNADWRSGERGKRGYLGGAIIGSGIYNGRPLAWRPVPPGTPRWGKAWKAATAKWYGRTMRLIASGSVMPNRWNYYDLDPAYRNAFGQPLMRMTFDFKDNEQRMGIHIAESLHQLAGALKPSMSSVPPPWPFWLSFPYQSTHNAGGTIMGAEPGASAVNKYGQSWDCENLFVLGASVFPHNSAYNPTGLVGALSYFTAGAIRERYLRRPGFLS